jgi:hypothetical protein
MRTIVVNRHFNNYDIYIGRGTIWGCPFVIGRDGDRDEVIRLYEIYARNNPEIMDNLYKLEGRILGCSCKPLKCHGDILVKLIEENKK